MQNYDNLNGIINKSNELKNIITAEFIKGLSELKIISHDTIKITLQTIAQNVCDMLNQKYKPEALNEILQYLMNDAQKINSIRDSALTDHLKFLEINNIADKTARTKQLLLYVHTVFNNIHFSWKISPVANVRDLSNINVIETVIKAADI